MGRRQDRVTRCSVAWVLNPNNATSEDGKGRNVSSVKLPLCTKLE